MTVDQYKKLLGQNSKGKSKGRDKGKLARAFEFQWKLIDGPPLRKEHRFHSVRQWHFDYAVEPAALLKIAIELEGGTWIGGAHTRGKGYTKDCEKYNAAIRLGWRVFRLTTDMVRDDPAGHLTPIKNFIENEMRRVQKKFIEEIERGQSTSQRTTCQRVIEAAAADQRPSGLDR